MRLPFMALNGLFCAEVPLSNYPLTEPSLLLSFEGNLLTQRHQISSLETRD